MVTKEERFTRSLPCPFTADELRMKADDLADKVAKKEAMEEEKKSVQQDYKHRIDALTGEIGLLARHISQKQEHRQIECVALLDNPEFGKKSVYRTDSGELVAVEGMSAADRQLAFKYGSEAKGSSEYDAADDYDGPQFEHEDGDEQGAVIEVAEPAPEASEDVDPFTAAVAGEE